MEFHLTYRRTVDVLTVLENTSTIEAWSARARSLRQRLENLVPDARSGDDYRALLEANQWFGSILVDEIERALVAVRTGAKFTSPAMMLRAIELEARIAGDLAGEPEAESLAEDALRFMADLDA